MADLVKYDIKLLPDTNHSKILGLPNGRLGFELMLIDRAKASGVVPEITSREGNLAFKDLIFSILKIFKYDKIHLNGLSPLIRLTIVCNYEEKIFEGSIEDISRGIYSYNEANLREYEKYKRAEQGELIFFDVNDREKIIQHLNTAMKVHGTGNIIHDMTNKEAIED